jgi:hypothetical protein
MTYKRITHYKWYGYIDAIQATSINEPLFTVQDVEEYGFETALLEGLKKWTCDNADLYKLSPDIQPDGLSFELSNKSTYVNRRISIVRFVQTYHSIPMYGRSQYITLVVIDKKDVLKISGRILDEKQHYRGLSNPISLEIAIESMRNHWTKQHTDVDIFVRDVRKVALPDKQMIGYVGEISKRIFTSSRLIQGEVIIDAETGGLVLINELTEKAEINVKNVEAKVIGLQLKDNPRTETKRIFTGVPAKVFGDFSTIHFEANPELDCDDVWWTDYRMGNDTRFTILDFKNTDGSNASLIANITVDACLFDPSVPPFFNSSTIDFLGNVLVTPGFLAQDLIVKADRILNAIDPMMGELVQFGTFDLDSEHPYLWDHHPDVTESFHQSPFIIVINSSSEFTDNNPGIFKGIWASEEDTESLDLPLPHPTVYVPRGGGSKEQYIDVVCVRSPMPFHTHTFFHEMGHYYDNHNTFGILDGDLQEIVPQLFSLYLHRKLYPKLPYTLATLSEEGHCSLSYLIHQNAGLVVHPDCVDEQSDIAQSIEVSNDGYSIRAFTQAFWSLLFGVSCSADSIPIECDQPDNLPNNYEDRWMEALLFALQMGNFQGLVEFWDNMEIFISLNYPQDLDLLQSVRAFHGIQ